MLDKIRSAALEGYIKNKYSSYFENRDFSATLNTTEKYLKIKATLAGEDSQTVLDIENFEIIDIEEGKALIVKKVSSNRVWIQKIAEDFLLGKPIKLPSFVASAL
ncbi:MAG: hypothetical protein J6B07_03180 [Opitutales bacterium]|nr:hypothetical protein [Opitutales bacterium]